MPGSSLAQILLLLGSAVAIVPLFHRLHIPSSLAYLLIGLLLGPHTAGPVVDALPLQALAEFGIVFLLFTIGLNFSLPQIHALRHLVLGLGTAQVVLTTFAVGAIGWTAGLAPSAAFVVGAVFAQSSTTIISRQLAEQSEEHARHARLGMAMSVFQDVTAVPFVVVIPVLATAGAVALGASLAWALAKAALALVLVVFVGRWLLRPLFHLVAARRSPELFTLTVLFVALAAGATTQGLGLSMAFGAFLAGMVLGDTEFRHQVETTIRPFRDVLLGLFFVGIGMLVDPALVMRLWPWGLLGATLLLTIKCLLVVALVRRSGIDWLTSWRTGLLLAVGGEFGFALLALGLGAAQLLVITHADTAAAVRTLQQVRARHPALPVMVRTRDLGGVEALRNAGATEIFPETLEASLMIASQALLTAGVPLARVLRQVRAQRAGHYRQLRELFPGDATHLSSDDDPEADRLHALRLPQDSGLAGQPLSALPLDGLVITALVRSGQRQLQPPPDTLAQGGDTLVLFGPPDALARAEAGLLA